MWAVIAVLGLILGLASSFLSAVVYIGLSKKLEQKDISKLLEKSSEEISANYARQLRGIETEWEDIYQKFTRLTGRVEKAKGLDSSASAKPQVEEPPPMTRASILRRFREVRHE